MYLYLLVLCIGCFSGIKESFQVIGPLFLIIVFVFSSSFPRLAIDGIVSVNWCFELYVTVDPHLMILLFHPSENIE